MKSFAKINVFLKIIRPVDGYHKIVSRFILVENLYDELEFIDFNGDKVVCDKSIEGENIVMKTASILALNYPKVNDFFKNHSVMIKKNIPMGAGLGGGSSNSATFLKMINKELRLKLSINEMVGISRKIGSDIAFFLYGFKSANVSSFGEIVQEYNDEIPDITIKNSNISCSTALVYDCYRRNFMSKDALISSTNMSNLLIKQTSDKILKKYRNFELNDLFFPCEKLYSIGLRENQFLSGSGGCYFILKV